MSQVVGSGVAAGENVTRLVQYRPGKPIEEVQRELGLERVIKLASNENSLGPSPRAMEAIRESAARVHLYPDALCHDLREAVACRLDVSPDQLVFGNGSDDIIHLLGVTFLNAGDEVIQADPTFVRYEAAAILNRAICHKVPLRDWKHDLPAMADRINERTRLIFIANPNNPTGTIVTASEVLEFLDHVPDRTILVFDEAYFEYVEAPEFPDVLSLIREQRNVITLRTFSKMYGLAGIRIGFGVTTPQIAGYLNRVREPFNVSSIAQFAALAALDDTDHVRRTRTMNSCGKQLFAERFTKMGLSFTPTEANFVWVDVGRDSRVVFDKLLHAGIITRTGDIFGAPTHLRVTIGAEPENQAFLAALPEALLD